MYFWLICWAITYYIIVHAVSNYPLFCRSWVMITSSIISFVIILSNVIWKLIFHEESVGIFQFNLDIIQELHLFLDYLRRTEKFLTKYEQIFVRNTPFTGYVMSVIPTDKLTKAADILETIDILLSDSYLDKNFSVRRR